MLEPQIENSRWAGALNIDKVTRLNSGWVCKPGMGWTRFARLYLIDFCDVTVDFCDVTVDFCDVTVDFVILKLIFCDVTVCNS